MGFATNRVGIVKALRMWLSAVTAGLIMVPGAEMWAFSSTGRISGRVMGIEMPTKPAGSQSMCRPKTEIWISNGIAIRSRAVRFLRPRGVDEKVPLSIQGARWVLDFLNLRPDGTLSDTATRSRADRALDGNSCASSLVIGMTAQEGSVMLDGSIDTQLESLRIRDLAHAMRRVLNILKGLASPVLGGRKWLSIKADGDRSRQK